MKIIIISDDFPPKSSGGAAIIAYNQAFALRDSGYEVVVLTTVENRLEIGESVENGIRIIRIYSKYNPRYRSYLSLYNPFILSNVRENLKKEKADIIHFHNIHYHFSYRSIALASRYSKVLFITIHDSMSFHYSKLFPDFPYEIPVKSYRISLWRQLKDFRFRFNPFKNIIIRHYLKIPRKIFSVSNALKKALNDNGIDNVEVVHNGIDVNKWIADAQSIEDFKKTHNLLNKKIIMFCGRLSRAKGGKLIIHCMPEILRSFPDVVLLIVGEKDIEASNMLAIAKRLDIDKQVVFTGKLSRNSIINAYGACDMVIVPSLCFDWFPTVNLEAMVMRKPIVATCFGGSNELVENGKTGYIINPYHDREIVESCVELLLDDEKRIASGNNGYEKITQQFSVGHFIENIISWYRKYI